MIRIFPHRGQFCWKKLAAKLYPGSQHQRFHSQRFRMWLWGTAHLLTRTWARLDPQIQIPSRVDQKLAYVWGKKTNFRTISRCIWSKGSFSQEVSRIGLKMFIWYWLSVRYPCSNWVNSESQRGTYEIFAWDNRYKQSQAILCMLWGSWPQDARRRPSSTSNSSLSFPRRGQYHFHCRLQQSFCAGITSTFVKIQEA